ncbi:TNT domain-containing protein [Actinocatenispora rupis]
MHEPVNTVLKAGARIDGFGHDFGSSVAKEGTALSHRSMRLGAEKAAYSVFEVQSDLEVLGGIAAPAFGQPGGGFQHALPESVKDLLKSGVIPGPDGASYLEFAAGLHRPWPEQARNGIPAPTGCGRPVRAPSRRAGSPWSWVA